MTVNEAALDIGRHGHPIRLAVFGREGVERSTHFGQGLLRGAPAAPLRSPRHRQRDQDFASRRAAVMKGELVRVAAEKPLTVLRLERLIAFRADASGAARIGRTGHGTGRRRNVESFRYHRASPFERRCKGRFSASVLHGMTGPRNPHELEDALNMRAGSTEAMTVQILAQIRDSLSTIGREQGTIRETLTETRDRVIVLEQRDQRVATLESLVATLDTRIDILLKDKDRRDGAVTFGQAIIKALPSVSLGAILAAVAAWFAKTVH
jgi:hypothetical protein